MASAPDILVIGGGNAALCAAIEASCRTGRKVVLLEGAPKAYRGGNSRHTRNFRCMHQGEIGVLKGCYDEEEFYQDLLEVTKGKTDKKLARKTISSTEECYGWMQKHGVYFQPPLSGTLSLSRTNAFFLGGGKALVNAYYRMAIALGVEVIYNAHVNHLEFDGTRISQVHADLDGQKTIFKPRAVIVASGGFQANKDWLAEAWGDAAHNFLIRGTPYNKGVVLRDLIDQGIDSVGDAAQCHAVAIDGRAPEYDGGIVTRLDCVPFSIVLNKHGQRFYDEGEDVWPKRYAIWGRLVAAQDDQVAYAIIDSRALDLFMPSVFPPEKADTLEGLCKALGLPVAQAMKTIEHFNKACCDGAFIPAELDGLSTTGVVPPKTNWARPVITPPFYGYELRPGITFTYLGLKTDEFANVQANNRPVENLWAAGEIMAGSILGQGYLAGFGMAIGTVFGRLAGQEAAKYVG